MHQTNDNPVRVRVQRVNGEMAEGVIYAPFAPLAHIGTWYRVYRDAPVQFTSRARKGKKGPVVDIVDEIGLYPAERIEVVA